MLHDYWEKMNGDACHVWRTLVNGMWINQVPAVDILQYWKNKRRQHEWSLHLRDNNGLEAGSDHQKTWIIQGIDMRDGSLLYPPSLHLSFITRAAANNIIISESSVDYLGLNSIDKFFSLQNKRIFRKMSPKWRLQTKLYYDNWQRKAANPNT